MSSALCVLCASVTFAVAMLPATRSSRVAAAETDSSAAELVSHAKSSADHQTLVKWYEQREDEARHQAEIYRKLARDYEHYSTTTMTTACDEIARYYDEIAQQLEKLAEQHRHLAAAAQ